MSDLMLCFRVALLLLAVMCLSSRSALIAAQTTTATVEITTTTNATSTTTTPTTVVSTTTIAVTAGPATMASIVVNATAAPPSSSSSTMFSGFTPVRILVMPDTLTGSQIRGGATTVHLLLRDAHWVPPVGSHVALRPIDLAGGDLPVVAPVRWSNSQTGTGVILSPQQQLPWSAAYANVSTWAEAVNQEDEALDATVQLALTRGSMQCRVVIVSVSEGNLLCSGTVFPSEAERLVFVLPPFLLRSIDANATNYTDSPQNAPFTGVVLINPDESVLQLVRRIATAILALVALVAIIVGKEPHIHIMSLARMSLIGRLLECSDEVDFILHPTQISLGRGVEKGRYFGCLIFNTAITMGLLIGHNVIARISPRLLPDPPPATQFVIAGALLPGIALAGIKTITLQSSPVQFVLAVVVMVLFIGAWFGCYFVTARDKDFFHKFGRWQHRTDAFFMLRWRVFFTSYTANRRFYMLIEIVVTLLMAVPSGMTLAQYLPRELSCRYRSIAMVVLVALDLVVMLALKPYAIQMDRIVYAVSKLFEVALAASSVATAMGVDVFFTIGSAFWIAGAIFIAGWQAVRSYSKAQYNSQQNEFFLTTADTADVSFHELGDDADGHGAGDESAAAAAAGGAPSGSPGTAASGGPGGRGGRKQQQQSTLASLFPSTDYNDDDYGEDDDDVRAATAYGRDAEAASMLGLVGRPSTSSKSMNNKSQSPKTGGESSRSSALPMSTPWSMTYGSQRPPAADAATRASPVKKSLAGASGVSAAPAPVQMTSSSSSAAAAATAAAHSSSNKDRTIARLVEVEGDVEMALLASAPRLQVAPRIETFDRADPYGSVVDDGLVDFWDAVIDSPVAAATTSASGASGANSKAVAAIRAPDDGREVGHRPIAGATPKIALREAAVARAFSEATPCRMRESLEAPATVVVVESPRGGGGGGGSASERGLSVSDGDGAGFLPAHFVDDDFAQRVAKLGTVAEDGVGVDL